MIIFLHKSGRSVMPTMYINRWKELVETWHEYRRSNHRKIAFLWFERNQETDHRDLT